MAEDDVRGYFFEKLKQFAVHACTVVFDIGLGGVWLIGEYCLEHFLIPQFRVDSIVSVAALWAFRILFAVSTLIPCASKIFKHVKIVWLRDRAEVRQFKQGLDLAASEEPRVKPVASVSKAEGQR